MDHTAAAATLEGRYAALRAGAHELSVEELLDVIELAQREKDAASARQAVALAHLSAWDTHRQEDGTVTEIHHGLGHQRMDAPELAAPRLGCSVHVAANRILDAIRQMTRTPAVVDAMANGDLDEQRAAAVTDETEYLSPESAAAVVDIVEPLWRGLTIGPLRRLLARAAAQVDPDAVAAHAADERTRRGLTRRTGVHGTDHWRGDFLVEKSRGAWAAVTELARKRVRDGHADTLDVARADALMDLVLDHCDVKVVVHTTRAADDHTTTTSHSGSSATPTSDARNNASTASDSASRHATGNTPAPRPATATTGTATATRAATTPAATGAATPARAATTPAAPAVTSSPVATASTSSASKLAGQSGAAEAGRYADTWAGFTASAGDDGAGEPEGLVEVGGFAGPGTTFLPHDYLDAVGTTDPIRGLTCHPATGALLTGDVPPSLARGQAQARAAHRARERKKGRAKDEATECAGLEAHEKDVVDFAESYRVPDGMARLIRLRDGACRFPGCSVTAHQCDIDHVRPWPAGPTTPTNLMCLCRHHHRIKQRDGWNARLHPDATVTWTDPTGYTTTTRPVDHLHLLTTHRNQHVATDSATPGDTRPSGLATPGRLGAVRTHRPRVPILSDFEEALADLLDTATRTHPNLYRGAAISSNTTSQRHYFDADGTPRGGPLPRIDLDTLDHPRATGACRASRTQTRHTLVLDYPPRPPQAPQPQEDIPF